MPRIRRSRHIRDRGQDGPYEPRRGRGRLNTGRSNPRTPPIQSARFDFPPDAVF